MLEMIDLYQKHRASGKWDKKAFLREAAQIPGMYVPSLYEVSYHQDGTHCRYYPKGRRSREDHQAHHQGF